MASGRELPPQLDNGTQRSIAAAGEHVLVLAGTTRSEVHRLLQQGRTRQEIASELAIAKSTVSYHARRLGAAMDARAARRYDWHEIQAYYEAGHSVRECRARFGFGSGAWSQAAKRGDVRPRPAAMPIEVLLRGPRGRAHLKDRLVKAGLLDLSCRRCGLERWRSEPISLELHHINGVAQDNRLENLTLLCPNCHSQTDSWGGRNRSADPGAPRAA